MQPAIILMQPDNSGPFTRDRDVLGPVHSNPEVLMAFGERFFHAQDDIRCGVYVRVYRRHVRFGDEPSRERRPSVGDFGVGGWTQNFSAKPFTGGGVSVQSSPVQEVVDFHATLTRRELTDWRHPPLWLPSDDDCLFVSSPTSAGHRWRPSCK